MAREVVGPTPEGVGSEIDALLRRYFAQELQDEEAIAGEVCEQVVALLDEQGVTATALLELLQRSLNDAAPA